VAGAAPGRSLADAVGQGTPGKTGAAHYVRRGACSARNPGFGCEALPRQPAPAARSPTGRDSTDLVGVGREALAAAALGRGLRVAERELLVQALLQEVHLGAVDQRQAFGVDEDAHAVLLEDRVAGLFVPGEVDGVAPAGTPRAAHAEAQAQGPGVGSKVALHAFEGSRSEGDGHAAILPVRGHAGPRAAGRCVR